MGPFGRRGCFQCWFVGGMPIRADRKSAPLPSICQTLTRDPLKNRSRSHLPIRQTLPRNNHSLFQSQSPAQNRMRNHIRKHQPSRPRRQIESIPRTIPLIRFIPLQPIVEMQHERVVSRPIDQRRPSFAQNASSRPPHAIQPGSRGKPVQPRRPSLPLPRSIPNASAPPSRLLSTLPCPP